MRIWAVMDDCIRMGVTTTETTLPGRLRLRRRAPMLYQRLMRGYDAQKTHLTLTIASILFSLQILSRNFISQSTSNHWIR